MPQLKQQTQTPIFTSSREFLACLKRMEDAFNLHQSGLYLRGIPDKPQPEDVQTLTNTIH